MTINGFLSQSLINVVIITLDTLNLTAAKPYEVFFFFFFYNPWSSHALPWVDSAHGTHPLGIKLPPDANSHHPPGHHWEPSSPVCHHSDEMTGGCSLCLIKGIEECPSTGNPAPCCLNPAAWVISDQSCACFPVISDKGPSDPWRSYLW